MTDDERALLLDIAQAILMLIPPAGRNLSLGIAELADKVLRGQPKPIDSATSGNRDSSLLSRRAGEKAAPPSC